MTTPTPRELSADEIAAIRERDAAMRNRTYPTNLSLADLLWAADDRADLLAHVAAVDARCRAYEADFKALAAQVPRIDSAGDVQIEDLEVSYGEMCDMAKVRLTALMAVATLDGIRKRREREALAATDGSGRDGNGEAR